MSDVKEIFNPFAIFQSIGLKAEFPLFPQALEVFRYNQADIFQERYPVRI